MIFLNRIKKHNFIYRWGMILAIAILAVFGGVLIIYENWQLSLDNLNGFLSQSQVKIYVHFSKSDSSWLNFPLFSDVAKNFFPQFQNQLDVVLANKQIKEASFVVLQAEDGPVSGWLVLTEDNQPMILPKHWQVNELASIKIISTDDDFNKQIRNHYLNNDNLRKYFVRRGIAQGIDNYIYINLNQAEILDNYNADKLKLPWPSGNWLITHSNKRIKIFDLNHNDKFTFFAFNWFKPLWLQVFLGKNIVGYSLNKDLLIDLLGSKEVPNYVKDKINLWENKYQIKIFDLLESITSPMDIALDYQDNKINWVIKANINNVGWKMIEQIITRQLAYANPVIKQTVLPDNTKIKEIKPGHKDLQYQKVNLNDNLINIVYLSPQAYFIWFEQEGYKVLSNDMRLMGSYLDRKSKKNTFSCSYKPGGSLVINFNTKEASRLGIKALIFSGLNNSDNNGSGFTICYE